MARHVRVVRLQYQGGCRGFSPCDDRRCHVDEHKAERLEDERDEEMDEGIAAHRRGSKPAPSDKPEGTAPHPQDVNEIAE
jgi:hypothetical protein